MKLSGAGRSKADEPRQAVIWGIEGDSGALWEVEDIAWFGLDLLAGLIFNTHSALDNDLHLIVGISVGQWLALLLSVEARGQGLVGVRVGVDHITQKGVIAGNKRWLDLLSFSTGNNL